MEAYSYLYKRVAMTSKARYEASRRLSLQSWSSQWTLAFMAIGQIVLSLLSILKLTNTSVISLDFQNLMTVFFAVVVLAYSLLLGMGDFSARAASIHQCGLELAELAREVNFLVKKGEKSEQEKYTDIVKRYYSCLNRHENHSSHDYLVAKLEFKGEESKAIIANKTIDNSVDEKQIKLQKGGLTNSEEFIRIKIAIYLHRIIGFSHYPISMIAISLWIYAIFSLTPVTA